MNQLRHPLVLSLLAFLAGLLPALRYSLAPLPFVALGLLLAAAGARRTVDHQRAIGGSRGAHFLLGLAFLAAGAAFGGAAAARAAADCRLHIPERTELRVSGVLAAGAGTKAGDGRLPILPLQRARVEWVGGSCAAPLRVRLPETVEGTAGTRVQLDGVWVPAPRALRRSEWPRRPLLAGFVAADSGAAVGRVGLLADPLLALRGGTEERIRTLFPRHDALAEALLLGRRERMDPELRERFARAGLIHLLAISGTHVGVLAAVVLLLGTVLRLSRRRTVWLTLGSMAAYLAMIGAPASAIRAGIMLALALLAVLLQRPAAILPIVAAAALALLALDPLFVLDPGYQLSFAGAGGILIVHRAVRPLVPAEWTRARLARWLVESLLVSGAAFLATAPITAHHFGAVAPVALLANLPALPLMSLALVGVLAATLLAPLLPPVAALFADAAGLCFDLLDRVARTAAKVPLGHLETDRPSWGTWLLAALAAIVALDLLTRGRPAIRAVVAAGSAGAILLAWPVLARAAPGALELHFLDVGQGDATAVRTPAGRWILVDAGPRSADFDAGMRRVLPYLRARGARRLEALVLTHPHLDHIGGAPSILRAIPAGTVVDPAFVTGSPAYLDLLREVERSDARWMVARSGRSITVDGIVMDILWPDSSSLDDAHDANQISVVIRLRFGEFAALLTGDAPEEVERLLVERHGAALRSQVLKAGHHGSATSTSAELLEAVRPEVAIVSAGRRNRYGHPARETLRRLEAAGVPVVRTDRDGTVTLRARGGGAAWQRVDP